MTETILTFRILDLLIDDEEYLEELFLDVNYGGDTERLIPRRRRFRLAEIAAELASLQVRGLIDTRVDEGWPAGCGITRVFFRLTESGKSAWRQHVEPLGAHRLYDE